MKLFIFFIIMLFCYTLFAQQDTNSVSNQIKAIQSQPNTYYFGYAEGKQRKETDQKALQEMMSKIYIVISTETNSIFSESENGEVKDNLEQILNTYTYGRLPNVEQLSYKTGSVFHIFRYIKRADYQKIFENRKIEICGFLREAKENIVLNQLGKAFRNYYRAAIAIESLQEGSILFEEKMYSSDIIFDEIRDIATNIKIQLISNIYKFETRYIVLDFSYNNKPVNDLNILYYDLHNFIPQKTNSNLINLELYGKEYEEMEKLSLKIDLKENMFNSYNEETQIINRLFECEELEEYREIRLQKKKVKQIKKRNRIIAELNIEFENSGNCQILDKFAENLLTLFAMLDNEYLEDESIFTDKKIINRMKKVIEFNHTKLLNYPQKVQINKTDSGWEARQFGVSVSNEGLPTRNETIVIDFDDSGRIYNFCYTINPAMHELFKTQGIAVGDWDYRQIAIKFIENYKTSYTTKNIEDVETLYSEDAIIITGKVIKRTKIHSEIKTDFPNEDIIYFKRTKKEHIAHQKEIFKNNLFVWLQYDTFNISVAPIDSIYGVSMKQNYYSSTYKDEGYLFLLLDFRGKQPLIHIRNWQPGEWDLSKQMKLENFRFYSGGID